MLYILGVQDGVWCSAVAVKVLMRLRHTAGESKSIAFVAEDETTFHPAVMYRKQNNAKK